MVDVLGRKVSVGDVVSVATRSSNVACHRIATIAEIDEESRTFRISEEGKISKSMNMYFHEIERPEYCKVVILDKPNPGW